MQSLSIPVANNPNSHTPAEVLSALQGATGSRRWSFRYERLSSANIKLADLTGVLSCTVDHNQSLDIKRTAKLVLLDDGTIDYLQDRIRPWARLHIPPYGASDWVEWPMGVFILASPTRGVDAAGVVTRSVQGYDLLQYYKDDPVAARYTVDAGDVYTTEVNTLIGSVDRNIVASTLVVPASMEWDPGTPKLDIVNDMLAAVNYDSLFADENGVMVAQPYQSPADRAEEYTYVDDSTSVFHPEMEQTLDLFDVPNSWTMVVSQPDRAVLSSSYTNNDPSSLTSTVSRGRTIRSFKTVTNAADQATLDALVARAAFEASQVYEELVFTTGIMPIHSANDVLRMSYTGLALNAKFSELSWSMPLDADGTMRHTIRRVVQV